MAQSKQKNWTWLRKRYELGFTYRQIAEDYAKAFPGETVAHQVICKMAKKKGWKRDLTEQYEKAVNRKVIERAQKGDKTGKGAKIWPREKSDDETVDEAAEVAAETVEKHRKDADDLRMAAMRIIREVDENEAFKVVTKSGDEVTVQADVTKRAQALTNASRALSAAVDIERRSLALDKKEGPAGSGVFNVYTNVPDPDPVPDGI